MRRFLFAVLIAASGFACGASGSGQSSGESASSESSKGSSERSYRPGMELRLVDAPTDDVKEIVVTIRQVDVHTAAGGWSTLSTQTNTVDLLRLQNGIFTSLGVSSVPSGRITQFRLYVDETGPNYVTTPDGAQVPLKVPSGEQSGIKLKAGFDLPACAAGQITFDFDGKKSIFTHPTGQGDQWILRPVIRLKSVSFVEACGDGGTGSTTGSTADSGTTTGTTTGSTAGTTTGSTAGTTTGTTAGTTTGSTAGTTTGTTDGAGTTTGTTTGSTDGAGTTGTTTGTSDGAGAVDTGGSLPPPDPCATVTCSGDDYCFNGVCVDGLR